MKHFDDIQNEPINDVSAPRFDKYELQKQRLLFNLTRSKIICDSVSLWLSSFEGGMSKETFLGQIAKLDSDDELALKQIELSMGKRTIAKKRTAKPPLPKAGDIIQMLASEKLFIAVAGREEPLQGYIRKTYQTLKSLGRTYVLDLNDMRLEWVDKFQKGKSVEMLQKAKDSEFLIVVGLETPLDIPFYMGDTLNTLRRYRVEHKMPIISTFARFREKEKFFEYFQKFSV